MMIFTKKPEASTMSRGNTGFTLAEVLITLGIIGVVAAMTIPTLVANSQKAQYVTALKKVYTNFNQSLIQYSADNGCVGDLKCTGLFGGDSSAVGTILAPYFQIAKNCGVGLGCFSKNISGNIDGTGVRTSNINSNSTGGSAIYKFITADGIHIALLSNENCGPYDSSGATHSMDQVCGSLYIDVNGDKGPNNMGRDIFQFYITNGRGPELYPYGGQDDLEKVWNADLSNLQCNGTNNLDGQLCAARVIEEGWQMNY